MSFPQVEQIIVDELNWENYTIVSWSDYGLYSSRIVIPKSGNNPKIVIRIGSFVWSEETEQFQKWAHGGDIIESVTLKKFMSSQDIRIHGMPAKNAIYSVVMAYWNEKTKETREQRTVADGQWSDIFRKAFKK